MDEISEFHYITDLPLYTTEKPFYMSRDIPLGLPDNNIEYENHRDQPVIDVRGQSASFTLDNNGFEFYTWSPPIVKWKEEDDIKQTYLPAVKKLVEEKLGGGLRRCEIFDWRMRSAASQNPLQDLTGQEDQNLKKIAPAFIVHVDQSPQGVVEYMRRVFKDEADDLLTGRIRLVNVWVPLVDVIEDNALALCDAGSVHIEDFLAVDAVGEVLVRETLMAKYSDRFRFYYKSHMTRNDVCIFKVWDSDENVKAKFVPHCSFNHSRFVNPDAQPRESVECRVLTVAGA